MLLENGEPYVLRNEVEREELPVQKALLKESGQLTVELKVPKTYKEARLIIDSRESSVMLPQVVPQQDIARFIIETRSPGGLRHLSSSHLNALVTLAP